MKTNFLYANNSGADLRPFHAAIKASLESDGSLPDELADLFTVSKVDAADGNPDGSPRYTINPA